MVGHCRQCRSSASPVSPLCSISKRSTRSPADSYKLQVHPEPIPSCLVTQALLPSSQCRAFRLPSATLRPSRPTHKRSMYPIQPLHRPLLVELRRRFPHRHRHPRQRQHRPMQFRSFLELGLLQLIRLRSRYSCILLELRPLALTILETIVSLIRRCNACYIVHPWSHC